MAQEAVGNATAWLEEQIDAQKKRAPHESPAFTKASIDLRIAQLKIQLRPLQTRPRPTPTPTAKITVNGTDPLDNSTTANKTASDETAGQNSTEHSEGTSGETGGEEEEEGGEEKSEDSDGNGKEL